MLVEKPVAPPWLVIAFEELGVHETPGPQATQRILEYLHTFLNVSQDEVPWCACFVGWCFKQSQINISGMSAWARSWAKFGILSPSPLKIGSVVVLQRGNNSSTGHVGFYVGDADSESIWVLGGNQGDKVCQSRFMKSRIIAYRWPKEVAVA